MPEAKTAASADAASDQLAAILARAKQATQQLDQAAAEDEERGARERKEGEETSYEAAGLTSPAKCNKASAALDAVVPEVAAALEALTVAAEGGEAAEGKSSKK